VLNFPPTIAFNVGLCGPCIGISLPVMFKSDRSSMIMLAVNAGVPLASLVAVVALLFLHMILA
jgi:hypothetical protein